MLVATLVAWAGVACGHPARLPVSLEELIAEADIIFKGLVVSSRPAQDELFTPCPGLITQETQFTVISVIKGAPAGATVRFQHYDEIQQFKGNMCQMWRYHFQRNGAYIVFAKKTEDIHIHLQLWVNDLGKEDQGIFQCSDDKPVTANTVSPRNEPVERVLRANLENSEFQPLFLNALARENAEPYLGDLAKVVEQKTNPVNWMGGRIPALTAWEILFKYLQAQPAETLRSGKLDRYLDALEQVGDSSSSEPRDIYAFYILSDMTERAKKFRERATKAASYDLDYFFKQVDQNPKLYIRK